VRIRPAASAEDCGRSDAEPVRKRLAGWDATTVTMKDNDLRENTRFRVTGIIPPDVEQEEAFNTMMPELLDAFKANSNVFCFAYGQTGSGKTHTMLGEIESLSSTEPVPGWGVFPRVVHSTLQSMREWRAVGVRSVLLASAVEFYCGGAFDLNSAGAAKNEVTIDREANVFGTRSTELKSVKQLKKWITRMYASRLTAKTKMNDASSRSHCAFILSLHQLSADGNYHKTSFSMIDMAGSERHSKTGGERMSDVEAGQECAKMMMEGTPERTSIGAQGTMINIELSLLATEILKASDMHKKGIPYKAQKELSTAASFYFCACCDGRARIGACVTISQSPQHGFESWFSLRYAEQLAACRVPLFQVTPVPVAEALQAAAQAAEEAADKFAKANPNPQGAKQWRSYSLLQGTAAHTAETLSYLQRLMDQDTILAPGLGEEPDDESSDGSEIFARAFPGKVRVKSGCPKRSAIEMGKINENFSVFVRVRPLLEREVLAGAKNCFVIIDTDFPRVPPPQRITVQEASEGSACGSFVFNRVFEESHSQEEVYSATAMPYVVDFLQGTNVTIFAYGQTGTGKTFTIAGPSENPGIMTRCLSDVFAGLPATGNELYYEYVQLYMDEFKDLLAESKAALKLVDGRDGGVRVQNVTSCKAGSTDEVLAAVAAGARRRATRAQDMNEVSSRSHAILMLRLVELGGDPSMPVASMFIVDLAGSERIARSGVTGQGVDEAISINSSLTALGRVVVTLIDDASNSRTFVPYNGSPLTKVLKAGLGGNSKTALIACVTQAEDSICESVSTLRFAMQASHVKNKVEKKEAADRASAANDLITSAGNSLVMHGGHGVVELSSGPLEVWGRWEVEDVVVERAVVVLVDLKAEPATAQDLIDALAARNCNVIAPKLPGSTEKELEADVRVLLALFDWLGLAQPVVYGRDWGAIRACRFKISNPKRVSQLVLEEFNSKLNEKEFKEKAKKDPTGVVFCMGMGTFLWFFDGTFPKSLDGKAGNNMKGFKGKVKLLFPLCYKGKHDPNGRSGISKVADMFGRVLKTKPIDSFLMSVDDVATQIVS